MRTERVQSAFFFGLLFLTTVAFLWLIRSFLDPIFWATVLAIIFNPIKDRWVKATGGRQTLAAALTLVTIVVIVLLPLFFVTYSLSIETVNLYNRISTGNYDINTAFTLLERIPFADRVLERFNLTPETIIERAAGFAGAATQYIGSKLLSLGQDALRFLVSIAVMLYVLFFFLRDGQKIVNRLVQTLPLGDGKERELFSKFAGVSRATIKGTIVIGVVQGFIGGLLFWIAGISAPIFWGSIMTVFSIIPAVGTGVVWLPGAIYLFATGQIWQGVVVAGGGVVIIGLIDNILRPILVGRDTELPDALVLISTLGGLSVFGITGFVVGPVIAAFFLVVWEMFARDYSDSLEEH